MKVLCYLSDSELLILLIALFTIISLYYSLYLFHYTTHTLCCSFSSTIYLIKRFVIIVHSFANFLTKSRISSDETIGWSRICIEIDFWGMQFNSKWSRIRERERERERERCIREAPRSFVFIILSLWRG